MSGTRPITPNELKRIFAHATASIIKKNSKDKSSGLPACKPKRIERSPLECAGAGKGESGSRFEIVFTVYSIRPMDWDNHFTKGLQDMLVVAGILHDDAWHVLQGSVISRKVHAKEEEGTTIEIYEINP